MDSTAVVGFAQHAVNQFLPGLNPEVAMLLVGVIASLLLSLLRIVSGLFQRAAGVSADWWGEHRDAINPILAVLMGLFAAGSPIGAILGLAGHGIVKGATKLVGHTANVSKEALTKGKAVAFLLGLSLLALLASHALASPVRTLPNGFTVDEGVAVDPAPHTPFLDRLSWGFGPGVRFEARPGANVSVGYAVGTVGYVFNGHLNLKARAWRDAEQAPKGGGAVEALWVW